TLGTNGVTGVLQNGVSTSDVTYVPPGTYATHIFSGANVAGYWSWSKWGFNFNTNYYLLVTFSGSSDWYIMGTGESFNGVRNGDQGNFLQWFSATAFNGTSYS